MPFCPHCGLEIYVDLCPHHHAVYADDWHVANRIQCDFFHRGVIPERLPEPDRRDVEDTYSVGYGCG